MTEDFKFRLCFSGGGFRATFFSLGVYSRLVDDDPNDRWLSVCFFGDMITDPEEKGDLIPGGLLGEDGYCFDITEPDDKLAAYVEARIEEAYHSAAG